jgi:3-deoxy-D-manno-octulosonic acid (KDO) 8-phosphate synthase
MEKGLEILAKVKKTLGVPVLTDVHTAEKCPTVVQYVDVLQTLPSSAARRISSTPSRAPGSR